MISIKNLFLLFNLLFIFFPSTFVKSTYGLENKIFDEIGNGLSEKGIYLDFIKNVHKKNRLGVRVNYLPEDFITHKKIYFEGRNVNTEYFGIGILVKHYFLSEEARSNFYFLANADISSIKAYHKIDLSKETRTEGNIQIRCSACGTLKIESDPNKVHFIPSLSLGYQFKNTPNFSTNISLGLQFVNLGNLQYTVSKNGIPPTMKDWIMPRIDNYVKNSQDKLNSYSKFQPTISLGFSYLF